MRFRHAFAAAAVGTVLAFGAMSMSAQAAPASTNAVDAATRVTATAESSPVSALATWHPMDRYYWKWTCAADGVKATVGPGRWAMDYKCPRDTADSSYYRLWLLY